MRNFSWHSEPGLAPHWYKIYGWLPNRYLPIVMFGDSIPIYKPNMKGGHTHNHIYNKCNKHLFRGRSRRKIARKDKPEYVRIFHLNVKLGNVTMDSLMHTIFYHNKKNNP